MTEDHPFNNRTMYGATKIAGEQLFRAYHEQHGLDYVGLRYMNVYGPRMDYEGTYVSVIMKVLDRIDAGEPPVIFGDGTQAYDFVHVGDVARANILSLKSDATDVNLNVGTGIKTTIKELVDTLLEVTGSQLEPEYRPQEQMFVTHRVGSVELAEAARRLPGGDPLRGGAAVGRRMAVSATRRDWPSSALSALTGVGREGPDHEAGTRRGELARSAAPLESGWVVQGPIVEEFEDRFGDYIGAGHCVATTSCTTALHLAVAALGLGPGDEVLVPAFTWVSTPNVVEYMGATPRFADIDLATFNVDADALEAAVTERTVGILPVHLFGLCADMTAVHRRSRVATGCGRSRTRLARSARGRAAATPGRSGTWGRSASTRASRSPPARAAWSPRADDGARGHRPEPARPRRRPVRPRPSPRADVVPARRLSRAWASTTA